MNEIIKTILDFFIQKFHKHKKAQTSYKQTKDAYKKHLRGKKSLTLLFEFLCFCLVVSLCFWCFWCLWYMRNLFVKKIIEFKTALTTSFILLLFPVIFKTSCLFYNTFQVISSTKWGHRSLKNSCIKIPDQHKNCQQQENHCIEKNFYRYVLTDI